MNYVHKSRIIHKDIKPSNILIGLDGLVKIGDLSSAAFHGYGDWCYEANISEAREDVKHTTGVSTPGYAAPEVRNGSFYDYKADIYSLGIVLLDLFYPFTTEAEKAKYFHAPTESWHVPRDVEKMYPEVAALIVKMASSNPNDRPKLKELIASDLFGEWYILTGHLRTKREAGLENQQREGFGHLWTDSTFEILYRYARDVPSLKDVPLYKRKPIHVCSEVVYHHLRSIDDYEKYESARRAIHVLSDKHYLLSGRTFSKNFEGLTVNPRILGLNPLNEKSWSEAYFYESSKYQQQYMNGELIGEGFSGFVCKVQGRDSRENYTLWILLNLNYATRFTC